MNYILILLEVILSYVIMYILHKKYKIEGIYFFIMLATIMSNIMILNTIDILTYPISMGIGLTSSIMISSNIVAHKKGLNDIPKIIIIVIVSSIISYSLITLSAIIEISDINKYTNLSYSAIFENNMKLAVANIISLVVAIYISTKLYHTIKKIKNKIWLSNILSSIITEFISSIIFTLVAYLLDYKIIDLIMICIIRYTLKVIIDIIATPTIYLDDRTIK